MKNKFSRILKKIFRDKEGKLTEEVEYICPNCYNSGKMCSVCKKTDD